MNCHLLWQCLGSLQRGTVTIILSQLEAFMYLVTLLLYVFRFVEIHLLLVNRWLSEFSVCRKRLFCWEFWDFRVEQFFMEIFQRPEPNQRSNLKWEFQIFRILKYDVQDDFIINQPENYFFLLGYYLGIFTRCIAWQ